MKVIDLFSGIGGFCLGLESTGGFETIKFVENNEWCQKVLAKNFPGVPIIGDIKDYEGQKADVVTGGFPCQPFSIPGKRKGTDDNRHLWSEMLRVIKASKPRWCIGENVRNLTSIENGMVFEQVCTDLENEGYEVQSFIIPASAVNAPHQRYRVWIMGWKSDSSDECQKREVQERKNSESCRTSRLSKFKNESWWGVEPSVGRVANGIPRRVDRFKGLGNAIVPQIAYQIGLAILEAENETQQRF